MTRATLLRICRCRIEVGKKSCFDEAEGRVSLGNKKSFAGP